MNERPWQHRCHNGSNFTCERCDFKGFMLVADAPEDRGRFAEDVAEMIGFHAINIWPKLNGFTGYDSLRFEFI